MAQDSLYRTLLGEEWGLVAPAVRSMHLSGDRLTANGTLRIWNGKGAGAQLLSRLFGMPPESDACETKLTVRREESGEFWIREFGAHRLVSFQCADAAGLLIERFGPLFLRFRVTRDGSGLGYLQVGGGIAIGRASLQLPAKLVPRIEASESANGEACQIHVEISVPVVGLIASYEGTMRPQGDSA